MWLQRWDDSPFQFDKQIRYICFFDSVVGFGVVCQVGRFDLPLAWTHEPKRWNMPIMKCMFKPLQRVRVLKVKEA